MNNQAVQTMPALPRPYWKAGEVKDDYGNPYNETDLFTDDDMRAMYQQGYAAALSQTAGEAAPGRYFAGGPQGHFFADDLQLARDLVNLYDKDDDWTITDLRNPTGAAPAQSATSKTYDRCTDPENCKRCSEDASTPHAGIPHAAPAESGGEDVPFATTQMVVRALTHLGHSTPRSQEEQYARCNELVLTLCREVMAAKKETSAPSVSSVSVAKRLRDAIEGECDGLGITEESAESILRYIGFHPQGRIVGGREIDGVWVIEATSHSDLMPNQQLVRYDDYRRAIEQALTQQRGECVGEVANYGCAPEVVASVHWHTNVLNLPIGTKLYTTPQPSADAVRELVQRWREEAERIRAQEEHTNSPEDYAGFLDAKTDELESLLGRGGK